MPYCLRLNKQAVVLLLITAENLASPRMVLQVEDLLFSERRSNILGADSDTFVKSFLFTDFRAPNAGNV
jgi:hypothetical protein